MREVSADLRLCSTLRRRKLGLCFFRQFLACLMAALQWNALNFHSQTKWLVAERVMIKAFLLVPGRSLKTSIARNGGASRRELSP